MGSGRKSKGSKGPTATYQPDDDEIDGVPVEADDDEIDRLALRTMGELYDVTRNQGWTIRGMLPRPGVVMFSGPPSSLKTYIILSLCGTTAYGKPWYDGSKVAAGAVFYCSGENVDELPPRYMAWRRANEITGGARIDDNVISVMAHSKPFQGKVIGADGKEKKVFSLDLMSTDSVKKMVDIIKKRAQRMKVPVSIVVFDPVAALATAPLTDPNCRILVRNVKMVARQLQCSVILVNHTHRRNDQVSQGAFSLAALIDGNFIVTRDKAENIDAGTKDQSSADVIRLLGLRSEVKIVRLKRTRDVNVSFEFLGSLVGLDDDAEGNEIREIAMRCNGLAQKNALADDKAFMRRLQIAEVMAAGNQITISSLTRLAGFGHGGNQVNMVREAMMPVGVWHTLKDSAGVVKELRLFEKGATMRVECRLAPTPAPVATPAKTPVDDPVVEPEVRNRPPYAQKAKPTTKKGDKKKPYLIGYGTMQENEYWGLMLRPLDGEDRRGDFRKVIDTMRNMGGDMSKAEPVLAFIADQSESVTNEAVRLFGNPTVEAILRAASRLMTGNKLRAAKEAKKGKPKPDDQAEAA